ncbi:MAG: type IV pilus modification PilV family protein [Gemmatimonadota bacterium]
MTNGTRRAGFSLIEIIVALMILSFGILALGMSTGYVMAQVRASELRSERVAAIRDVSEQIRGTAWDGLEGFCQEQYSPSPNFTIRCAVTPAGDRLKRVHLVAVGPGYREDGFALEVADTFVISQARRP